MVPCSALNRRSNANTSSALFVSRLPVGSSASSSAGFIASARDGGSLLLPAAQVAGKVVLPGSQAYVGDQRRGSYGFIHLKDRSLSPGTRAFMQAVRDEEALCVEREARLAKIYA